KKERRGERTPALPEKTSAADGDGALGEGVQVSHDPTEGALDQDRDMVGLPQRQGLTVLVRQRGLVGHAERDLVGEALLELAEVTTDDVRTAVGGGTQVATLGEAVLDREA